MDEADNLRNSVSPELLSSTLRLTFGNNIAQPADISERSLAEIISALKCGVINGISYAHTIASLRNPELSEELQKQLKTTLPWFSTGLFRHRRAESEFASAIGMVLDFDHVTDIERAKTELIDQISSICCVFRSPRDGVKAVILFNQPIIDSIYYKACYQYMVHEVLQITGYQADEACKDASRAHFMSLDSDLIYRPQAQPFETANIMQRLNSQIRVTAHAEQIVDTQRLETLLNPRPAVPYIHPEDRTEDLSLATKIVTHLATQKLQYQDWIKVGCALKREFEDWGYPIWLIFCTNPHYRDREQELYKFWNSFKYPISRFGSIIYVGEKYGYRK